MKEWKVIECKSLTIKPIEEALNNLAKNRYEIFKIIEESFQYRIIAYKEMK